MITCPGWDDLLGTPLEWQMPVSKPNALASIPDSEDELERKRVQVIVSAISA